MRRRDLFRLLSLSALAVGGGTALAACGDEAAPGPRATDLVPVGSEVARSPGDPAAIPAQVAAMHASGAAMFGQVLAAEETSANVAYSPYSLSAALALTLNGAVGETQREFRGLFGGAPAGEINAGFNALTAHVEGLAGTFEKPDGDEAVVTLDVANQLFGQRGVTWEQPFLDTLAAQYAARLETLDFAADPEAARLTINDWVEEQTRDKIVDLLPPGSVTTDTRLTLVNTLYLKAPWLVPFEPSLTEEQEFHLVDGATVRVPMMRDTTRYTAFRQGEGWTSVRLDYAGEGAAMTVILPEQGRLDDVVHDVVAHGCASYLPTAQGTIALALPRWRIRTAADLGDPLGALGVVRAFDPSQADFSAMTRDEALVVSKVVQQVFVAVDEKGTEAAAATAVLVQAVSLPMPDAVVTVDRPFLFVIHDLEYGTPLFLGRVLDPTDGA